MFKLQKHFFFVTEVSPIGRSSPVAFSKYLFESICLNDNVICRILKGFITSKTAKCGSIYKKALEEDIRKTLEKRRNVLESLVTNE